MSRSGGKGGLFLKIGPQFRVSSSYHKYLFKYAKLETIMIPAINCYSLTTIHWDGMSASSYGSQVAYLFITKVPVSETRRSHW